MKDGEQTTKQPVGVEAMCWSCSKIWNISLLNTEDKGVKCTCGGYVITETGKAMTRPFFDAFDSRAPILEVDTFASTISDKITGVNKSKGGIILPD